jgi:lipoate-protein ligase A
LPDSAAVVIGSAQSASDFDPDRLATAGVGLVRRRSGGGAVLVAPGEQVWLDVFVPARDVLWQDDVGRSFYWLGEVYKAAIARVLDEPPERTAIVVNLGPAKAAPWSKVLCYAGLGAGEVTVAGDKVVGMSQRRQRSGAWIHSMALLSHRAEDLTDLLSGSRDDRAAAREALDRAGLADSAHLAEPLTRELIALLEGSSNQDAV